jgi:hypothetical protein
MADDQTVYMVKDDLGRLGAVWCKADNGGCARSIDPDLEGWEPAARIGRPAVQRVSDRRRAGSATGP